MSWRGDRVLAHRRTVGEEILELVVVQEVHGTVRGDGHRARCLCFAGRSSELHRRQGRTFPSSGLSLGW